MSADGVLDSEIEARRLLQSWAVWRGMLAGVAASIAFIHADLYPLLLQVRATEEGASTSIPLSAACQAELCAR